LAKVSNAYLIQMSNITKQGIENVKSKACDILLDHRLTQKAKDPKKAEAILNRLHVAEPKKRDAQARPEIVPDGVRQGIKKQGPTVVELQEEFGGAGNFHIPVEEHYMLENEEWRYDKFPEFYNGSNVLDYYDPDITKKLNELEREEEELLKMEGLQDEVMDDEEDESGVTMGELRNSLKEVRNKKALAKMNHKLKLKNKVVKKTVSLTEMEDDLKSKGFDVNTASLRSRSKVRRGIKEIEEGKDRVARMALEDDSDAGEVIQDDDIAMDEAGRRGRATNKKRLRGDVSDDDMEGVKPKKTGRTLTPAQRHLSAQARHRTLTAERREGTVPKRLPSKPVPESHVRLA